jgi:hypothetical protein
MNRRYAKALRKKIESLANTMLDEEAIKTPDLFPHWNPQAHYIDGDRVCYEGKLYKVLQSHDAQLTWTPVDAPSLFAEILAGQEGTEIGEWKQPDSTNPYMKGDKVTFNGKMYESTIDCNVWSPESYPTGWKEV